MSITKIHVAGIRVGFATKGPRLWCSDPKGLGPLKMKDDPPESVLPLPVKAGPGQRVIVDLESPAKDPYFQWHHRHTYLVERVEDGDAHAVLESIEVLK